MSRIFNIGISPDAGEPAVTLRSHGEKGLAVFATDGFVHLSVVVPALELRTERYVPDVGYVSDLVARFTARDLMALAAIVAGREPAAAPSKGGDILADPVVRAAVEMAAAMHSDDAGPVPAWALPVYSAVERAGLLSREDAA